MGQMRCQSRWVRDPDSKSLERLELLLQRGGLGDSSGFGRLFVDRPIDEQSVESARNHDEGLALLIGENDIVSGRKAEIYLPGYQGSDVGTASTCGRHIYIQPFFGEKILRLSQINRRH